MSSYLGDQGPVPILDTTPWQVHLAEKMYSETGDPKLKSFFGSQGWNTGIIDKLFALTKKEWLPGADIVLGMSANTGLTQETAKSFLKNYPDYVGKDVIEGPFAEIEKMFTKTVQSTGAVAEKLPLILMLLAVGVTGYLIFAGKAGVGLIPGSINTRKNPCGKRRS